MLLWVNKDNCPLIISDTPFYLEHCYTTYISRVENEKELCAYIIYAHSSFSFSTFDIFNNTKIKNNIK